MTRQVLMVLGPSRGGAGLAAAVLGSLGYSIPPPVATMTDTSSDDVGVPTWMADFHNDLLRRSSVLTGDARPEAWGAVSSSCYDEATIAQAQSWLAGQLAGAEHILLRDPRLTWFATLWEQAARGGRGQPRLPPSAQPARGYREGKRPVVADAVDAYRSSGILDQHDALCRTGNAGQAPCHHLPATVGG